MEDAVAWIYVFGPFSERSGHNQNSHFGGDSRVRVIADRRRLKHKNSHILAVVQLTVHQSGVMIP